MPAGPGQPFPFDATALNQLACPACLGELRQEDAQLVCGACGRAYPVEDGIPVLIVDRAVDPRPST